MGYSPPRQPVGKLYSGPFSGRRLCSDSAVRAAAEQASSNNLVSGEKFTQGRQKQARGLGGITGYGKRMVRSGATLLQDRYSARGLTFLTLTVPPLARADRQRVAAEWGRMMSRLNQWIQRQLKAAGRKPSLIGVTEVQSGRFSRYGESYLHAHVVCPSRAVGGGWAINVGDLREWWRSEIERVIGAPVSHVPRVQAEPVRHDAAGYLGKYMSKGEASVVGVVGDLGPESVPGQWWFCSSTVRKAVKRRLLTSRAAAMVVEAWIEQALADDDYSYFQWLFPVVVEWEGASLLVGWSGRLTKDSYAELCGMVMTSTR